MDKLLRERREAAETMQKKDIQDLSNLAARSQALILESLFFFGSKTKSDDIVNQLITLQGKAIEDFTALSQAQILEMQCPSMFTL